MPDDEAIYQGRRESGRARHTRRSRAGTVQAIKTSASLTFPVQRGMRHDATEPEVSHPGGNDRGETRSSNRGTGAEIDTGAILMSVGKEIYLAAVKETVELVALEAASQAVGEETDRMHGLHQREEHRDRWDGGGRSHRRAASRGGDIPAPSNRPGMVSADSASGSMYDGGSSSPVRITSHIRRNSNAPAHGNIIGNGNGQGNGSSNGPAPGHRRRGSRHSSMAQGEGSAIVAAAVSGGGGGWKEDEEKAGIAVAPPTPFKDTSDNMDDDERETLMSLLTGAYLQVNELTDELQVSLEKLHDVEKELKECSRSQSNSQLLPKTAGSPTKQQPVEEPEMDEARGRAQPKRKPVTKFLMGMFPSDEGARSTPANVRQLQVEVQRLRQRVMQANSKEEKHRADLARNQRLMAVMESQLSNPEAAEGAGSRPSPVSRGPPVVKAPPVYCATPGGTRYHDGVNKPLVARVAELEEKLVNCSMENATAKQDYLTSKLRSSQLEKNTQRLRHELAKSRAMNDLLQNEIDRLQGTMSPEAEADGKGWRRWLGGVQEPLSPEPHPIRVNGDSDSPVVVVRDLDNNQLVYAPGRSDFF